MPDLGFAYGVYVKSFCNFKKFNKKNNGNASCVILAMGPMAKYSAVWIVFCELIDMMSLILMGKDDLIKSISFACWGYRVFFIMTELEMLLKFLFYLSVTDV